MFWPFFLWLEIIHALYVYYIFIALTANKYMNKGQRNRIPKTRILCDSWRINNQFYSIQLLVWAISVLQRTLLKVPQSNHTGLNNTTLPQQTHKALLIIRPKVAVMINVKKNTQKTSTSICAVYTKWAQLQEKGQQETKNRHRRFF